MPRDAIAAVAFVPIVCVRVRIHGYGCVRASDASVACSAHTYFFIDLIDWWSVDTLDYVRHTRNLKEGPSTGLCGQNRAHGDTMSRTYLPLDLCDHKGTDRCASRVALHFAIARARAASPSRGVAVDNLFQGETGVRATRRSSMGWRSSEVVCRTIFPRSANVYCGGNTRGVLCFVGVCFTTSRKN